MKKIVVILLTVFWTFSVSAQVIQDSQAKKQVSGQKTQETAIKMARQAIDQALAGILANLGALGIPGVALLVELLSEPAEPQMPGMTQADMADPQAGKAKITENMQVPDDTSKVTATQMKSVRSNQSSAKKELGMTGLANAWVYSVNAAQFPTEVENQNTGIQAAQTEQDMIMALSMATIQLIRNTAVLTDIAAQSIQSSAIQYNVGDSLQAPTTEKGATQ